MSEWQGFDQRKICPNCGNYQTSLSTGKRSSEPSHAPLLILVMALLGLLLLVIGAGLMITKGSTLGSFRLIGVIIGVSILLGTILFNREVRTALREYDQTLSVLLNPKAQERDLSPNDISETDQLIYRLYCRKCGYSWSMTAEEWEKAGQRERENLKDLPPLPPGEHHSIESFEKIEWKPPDPRRGIFIVVGAITIFFVASFSVLGFIWSSSHPDHPYTVIVNAVSLILALPIMIGLMVIRKISMAKIIPLTLLAFVSIGIALWLLLK